MRLFKKLSDYFETNRYQHIIPAGFDYKDLEEFQSVLFKEHEIARMKYDETNNNDFADIAIDCLVTINQLERLKLRTLIKNKLDW
ncbi:MAG: hypothetical protein ACTSQO_07060 [Candidatus Helarchaeota archaeon]